MRRRPKYTGRTVRSVIAIALLHLCWWVDARTESCFERDTVIVARIQSFPEFDIPKLIEPLADTVSCDVLLCLDSSDQMREALVVRSSGIAEIDLAAIRSCREIRVARDSSILSPERTAGFTLRASPEYHGSFRTGNVTATPMPLKGFALLSLFRSRITDCMKCLSSLPESPDEYRPFDFVATTRAQLIISLGNNDSIMPPAWISVLIDTAGLAIKTMLLRSCGNAYDDSLALVLARQNAYEAAIIGGHPVASWLAQRVDFAHAADSAAAAAPMDLEHSIDSESVSANYDTPAEMIRMVRPDYPAEAKFRNTAGKVWIRSLIDTTGGVSASEVMRSSGSVILDSAALRAAGKCVFSPALKDGQPVPTWVSYSVNFELDDGPLRKGEGQFFRRSHDVELREVENDNSAPWKRARRQADTLHADELPRLLGPAVLHDLMLKPGDTLHFSVRLLVDSSGRPGMVTFSGYHNDYLIMASLNEKIRSLSFSPAHAMGSAVACWLELPFTATSSRTRNDSRFQEVALQSITTDDWQVMANREPCSDTLTPDICAEIDSIDLPEQPMHDITIDSDKIALFDLCLGQDGAIESVQVIRLTGLGKLDTLIATCLLTAKFRPAERNFQKIASRAIIGLWAIHDVARRVIGGRNKPVQFRLLRIEAHFLRSLSGELEESCLPFQKFPAEDQHDSTPAILTASDDSVYFDEPPRLTKWVTPEYKFLSVTTSAYRSAVITSGTLEVMALIDTTGLVTDATLLSHLDNAPLEKAALDAAKKLKFIPAKKNGRPISLWLKYDLHYDPAHRVIYSNRLSELMK